MSTFSSTKLSLTFCQVVFIFLPIITHVQLKAIGQRRRIRSAGTREITWTPRQIETIEINIKEARDGLLNITTQMINEKTIRLTPYIINFTLDGFPISDLPPLDDPGKFTSNVTSTNVKNYKILSRVLEFVSAAYNHTSDDRVFNVKHRISTIMFIIEKFTDMSPSLTQNGVLNDNMEYHLSSDAERNVWDYIVFKDTLSILNNLLVQYTLIRGHLS